MGRVDNGVIQKGVGDSIPIIIQPHHRHRTDSQEAAGRVEARQDCKCRCRLITGILVRILFHLEISIKTSVNINNSMNCCSRLINIIFIICKDVNKLMRDLTKQPFGCVTNVGQILARGRGYNDNFRLIWKTFDPFVFLYIITNPRFIFYSGIYFQSQDVLQQNLLFNNCSN